MRPFLLVLSSPSGGGKSTIAQRLLETHEGLAYSVSATTRPARAGERAGQHYHFLARDEFERRKERGEFLEWAEFGGHLYGTLRSEVSRILSSGKVALLDIEVVGARQLRNQLPDAVFVFILPPSADVLVRRLTGRGTDAPDAVARRIHRAADEVKAAREYDYVVVNDDLNHAVAQVAAILAAESIRGNRLDQNLADRVERLWREVEAEAERLTSRTES